MRVCESVKLYKARRGDKFVKLSRGCTRFVGEPSKYYVLCVCVYAWLSLFGLDPIRA